MFKKKTDGTLFIDIYGDQPLTLQLNVNIDELMLKKTITLEVVSKDIPNFQEADLPQ